MKENLNYKEQRFKSILEDYSGEIDTNAVWSSIEDRVDSKRERPKTLWFFVLAGIPLAFICGLYVSSQLNNQIELVDSIQENESSLDILDTEIAQSNVKQVAEKETNEKSTNQDSALKKEVIVEYKTELVNASSNTINKSIHSSKFNLSTQNNLSSQILNRASTSKPYVNVESNKYNLNNTFIAESILTQKTDENQSYTFLQPLSELRRNRFLLTHSNRNRLEVQSIKSNYVSKHNRSVVPYVFIGGGVQQHSSNKLIVNQDLSEVLSEQFLRETAKVSWSSTFLIGIDLNRDWTISTGLFASNLTTQYRNQDSDIVSDTRNGVQLIEIENDGSENVTSGLIDIDRLIDYDLTWYQQQIELDAQIGIGRRLFSLGRFDTRIQSHFAYNIYNDVSGYAYNSEGLFTKEYESAESSTIEKSKIKMALEVPFEYHLNKFSIGLRPYYRYQFKSDLVGASMYTTKNSQLGITFGVTYRPR